jgi:hypothetical protein
MLPRKTFSFPLIEKVIKLYDRGMKGLRATVAKMGAFPPHHTTLWRWTEGLGERLHDRARTTSALVSDPERLEGDKRLVPTSALIAESNKGLEPRIGCTFRKAIDIPEFKYRSERRWEQLEACGRLSRVAEMFIPRRPFPLTTWSEWLCSRFHVAGWHFPTQSTQTRIQHRDPLGGGIGLPRRHLAPRKGGNRGSRPPP